MAEQEAVTDGELTSQPEYMLTTVDNPYNPFEDFRAWHAWDVAQGYHTSQILGRIAFTSDDLSPGDLQKAINDAIDEIVQENVFGVHRKVLSTSYGPDGLILNSEVS